MRIALHGCLRRRSFCFRVCGISNPASIHRLLRCGRSFFEAVDGSKRLTVSARFSIAVRLLHPARSRQINSVRGWRGLDQTQPELRHFQPGAFFRCIAVKCAIRSHSAAFARYSSFLFMGRFRQWLSFAHQSPNVQVVPTTAIRFRRSRRRPRRTGKTDARRLAAVGNNLRSPGRGYFFIRLSCDHGPTAPVGSAGRHVAPPARPAERGSRGLSPDRSLPKQAA